MEKRIANQLSNLPNSPGVYRFYDANGTLLYIGQAINLKRRVSSYFQKQILEPRLAELVRRISRIESVPTDSVLEAVILEANEINAKQPPFNVRLKDNKTFAIIGISDEDFPRVIVTRPTQKLNTPLKYQFGPYTSADQARTALRIIRKILPFRTTCQVRSPELKSRLTRGCLDYQIGLCPGACAGAITKQDYARIIRRIVLFLQGKKQQVSRDLKRAMLAAAKNNQFERAAQIRNQLFALDHIWDVALLKRERQDGIDNHKKFHRIEAFDISNLGSDAAVGSMVVIINGQAIKSEYRKFQIKTVIGQNDVAMLEEILTRRFRHLEWPLPDLVVVDGGAGHLRMALRVINKFRLSIPVIAAAKGPERKKLDLYFSHPELNYDFQLKSAIRLARDEAHRFAIRYHRSKRSQNFLS